MSTTIPLALVSVDDRGEEVGVKPGQRVWVKARPQCHFTPVLIQIEDCDCPASWAIHNIQVGTRSQLAAPTPISGRLFASGRNIGLRLSQCEPGMGIMFDVEYTGSAHEDGLVFRATIVGETRG